MFNITLQSDTLILTSNTIPEFQYIFRFEEKKFQNSALIAPAPEVTATLEKVPDYLKSDLLPGEIGNLIVYSDYVHFVYLNGEIVLSVTDWSYIWRQISA